MSGNKLKKMNFHPTSVACEEQSGFAKTV